MSVLTRPLNVGFRVPDDRTKSKTNITIFDLEKAMSLS